MTTACKQLKEMKGKLEILESKLSSVEGLIAALQEEAKNEKAEIFRTESGHCRTETATQIQGSD